jgi:hypothetical protein
MMPTSKADVSMIRFTPPELFADTFRGKYIISPLSEFEFWPAKEIARK